MPSIATRLRVSLVREPVPEGQGLSGRKLKSSEKAALAFFDVFGMSDREQVWAMTLNTGNQVVGYYRVSEGTLDSASMVPREVFKAAILDNAANLILAHNHPSGDPCPSLADRRVSTQVAEAGKVIGINVLDHVIICPERGRYYSMRDEGEI